LPGDLVQELNDLAWGEGTSGAVAASGQAKVYTDIAAEAPMARPASIRHGFRSLIVVPIKVKGETLGTLGLISHKEVQFGAEVVEMVTAMGNQLGIALSNARLFVDISRKNELLELLIEEAHHRIKNNLQMISGLLQLEADDAPTPGLRTAITRIQAIAQVHNLLSSEMPEKVDTHSLITTIVHMLTGTAPTYSGPPEMELDIEHLWLNADQAVALALIVNELTSNSLLHGQPPAGERLRLRVQCRQTDNEVCVIVSDNGGGLPADVDWRMSTGQGMSIVHQLAQINLRGSLVTGNRDGGLHAELRFTNAAPLTPRQPEP
jgi:two-component sensor histidine kinase